jgi:hemoglobin-like flavoprotein
VDATLIDTAKASYQRCCKFDEFIPSFYDNLFKASPEAKALFAETDFGVQIPLIKHAIGLLLIFPNHLDDHSPLLQRTADRHAKSDLAVPPELYPFWVDALMQAVQKYDTNYGADVEQAWREVMQPGIDYMIARYDAA